MSIDKKLLAIYGVFEISLLVSSVFFGKEWFYSSHVAFFSSLLILFATFKSYKKRVLSKIEDEKLNLEDEEDDWGENFHTNKGIKTDLNDENFKDEAGSELSAKEILKQEKAAIRNMPKFANLQTAFVPFRLMAYAVLVIGFLFLNRHENLNIIAFLSALGIMPIGALIYGAMSKDD